MLAASPQSNQLRPQAPDGDREFQGVLARADAGAIPPGFLADARNVRCRRGVAGTRPGVAKLAWANRTEAAAGPLIQAFGSINGVGSFKDPSSLDWTLLAADGTVFRMREGNPAQSIPLPAGVAILGPAVPVQAFNQVYLFRGRYLQPLVLNNFDTGFVDLVARWAAATVYTAPSVLAAASEVAYGPYQAVATLTSVGTTGTLATTLAHGFITGADVQIKGANQAEYNGRVNITVVDDYTFTFNFAGSATPTATGTITVSNNAYYWAALGSKLLTGVTIAAVSTTATVTKTAHGFSAGQSVTIAGATGADAGLYNGTFTIATAATNTFTYTTASAPVGAATGTITVANNSVVLAGQDPVTHPEAWRRLYTILPNANTALYTQNRLLVPTAFNPDTGEYDGKVDYVVATDYLDQIHFDFPQEFRINQGGDDEIVDLAKFNDQGTILVFKQKSVYVLANVALDLSAVSLDVVIPDYGLAAPRAWCVVGNNAYFLAGSRGVVGVSQTVQNKLQGVDIPLSDGIQDLIKRIVWRLAGGARMAWWDSKLYVAVPLDAGASQTINLVPAGATYPAGSHGGTVSYTVTGLVIGRTYHAVGDTNVGVAFHSMSCGGTFYQGNLDFVATATTATFTNTLASTTPATAVSGRIELTLTGVNNTILVYDFTAVGLQGRDVNSANAEGNRWDSTSSRGAWQGRDTGSALTVREFFTAYAQGRERLFFAGADGWVNLMEETTLGDQVPGAESASGISTEPINTYALTRGYAWQTVKQKRARKARLVLGTWQPKYGVNQVYAGVNKRKAMVSGRTKDRTRYYKPWNALPWDPSNVNRDQQNPDRQDYSVPLATTGVYFDGGILCDALQETTEKFKLTGDSGRLTQIEITNTQGRLELRGVEIDAQQTERRYGVTQ